MGPQVRRETVEDEQIVDQHRVFPGILLEWLDLDSLQGVAFLDEAADAADQDTDAVRLRRGHRPQSLDRDGLRAKRIAPVHERETLRRRSQLERPVERRVAAAQDRHCLVAVSGLVEDLVVDVHPLVAVHAGNA